MIVALMSEIEVNLLYYWQWKYYSEDTAVGDPIHYTLNQSSPAFTKAEPGDSIWAFSRRPDGSYVLVAELVVDAMGENEDGHRFGRYRAVADAKKSRFFSLQRQEGFEELVSEDLSVKANANPLGRAFQGHAAVRVLTAEDQRSLEAYANELPLLTHIKTEDQIISQAFEKLLSQFPKVRKSRFSRTPEIWKPFDSIKSRFQEWVSKYEYLNVEWSAGKGNWAQVPWIALLDERETDSIRYGVYICYLFREDMSGIFLTLLQGVTEILDEYGTIEAYSLLKQRGAELRENYPGLLERNFSAKPIDLQATKRGPHYEAATVAHKYYPASAIPNDSELYDDLLHLLQIYNQYAEIKGELDPPDWWREKIANLSVGTSKGEPSIYKPLFTLLLLSRALRNRPHKVAYEDIRGDIAAAMKRFGPDVDKYRPAYPFWHLQNDGFWEVVDTEKAPVTKSSNKPPGAWIRDTSGLVPEEYWKALVDDPVLVLELVDRLLKEYWPADEHDELRGYFGLYLQPEVKIDLATTVNRFAEALETSGISFGTEHKDFVRTFLASLATKRFVILTGLSGSGKTQIALKFGQWLGKEHFTLIPVRPDWTGAEALFGYEDALAPVSEDGRRGWAVPQALQFMLRATKDPANLYLLVLDEMNLAHVERYFADVLSGMESGTPVLPNLHREDDGIWRLRPEENKRLPVPKNLFIVGTVNIDETTYMFSPKVLDRANTLEFRVRTEDLSLAYKKPVPCSPGPRDLVRGFLEVSRTPDWYQEHLPVDLDVFTEYLRALHRILSEAGFEFGHRVFFEALRFAAIYSSAGEPNPLKALDRQVMQKILPRLHGSRRRLESTLCALANFCHDLSFEEGSVLSGKATTFDPLSDQNTSSQLPSSFDKLQRMTRNLRANQFTSFTE